MAEDGQDRVVGGKLPGDGLGELRIAPGRPRPGWRRAGCPDPTAGVDFVRGQLGALHELSADVRQIPRRSAPRRR